MTFPLTSRIGLCHLTKLRDLHVRLHRGAEGGGGEPRRRVEHHRDINSRFNVRQSDKIIGLAELTFDLAIYDIFGILSVGGELHLPRTLITLMIRRAGAT